ncbi:MAG: hypothetical protein ACFE0Q_10400 [Anaerolineae bacterium]
MVLTTIGQNHTPMSKDAYWWQTLIRVLDPIFDSMKRSSEGLSREQLLVELDQIHHAYSLAHRVTMPRDIQAQLIATLANLQTSYCARYEGQDRVSTKHHHIAQVEWVLFKNMLTREGIRHDL